MTNHGPSQASATVFVGNGYRAVPRDHEKDDKNSSMPCSPTTVVGNGYRAVLRDHEKDDKNSSMPCSPTTVVGNGYQAASATERTKKLSSSSSATNLLGGGYQVSPREADKKTSLRISATACVGHGYRLSNGEGREAIIHNIAYQFSRKWLLSFGCFVNDRLISRRTRFCEGEREREMMMLFEHIDGV